ncbi:MAG: TadE/TadG family type IV pilus assembly protein [Actinomycetota bacterium]
MRPKPADRNRTGDERGAALVEFAIVSSVLLILVFGVFETGMAWSDSQLVTQAARSGARSVSQLGIDTEADSFAVQSIEAALGDLSGDLTRIVIYDASAIDGSMSAACAAASPPGVAGQCSIYDQTDFGTYASWVDGAWPPSGRDNSLETGHNLGVLVEVDRPFITGFLGGTSFTMTDTTVMKIEPAAGS